MHRNSIPRTEYRIFQVHVSRRCEYTLKSKRESRFASLLECLIETGDVFEWWYEPHQFKCGRQYRKDRLYTPDFLISLNPVCDVFDTGTKCVWVEVKANLDQDGVSRFHWLFKQYPHFKDKMLLMVDRNPAGKRSKTAIRQRYLQDSARKYINRVLYASEYYPKFGIK